MTPGEAVPKISPRPEEAEVIFLPGAEPLATPHPEAAGLPQDEWHEGSSPQEAAHSKALASLTPKERGRYALINNKYLSLHGPNPRLDQVNLDELDEIDGIFVKMGYEPFYRATYERQVAHKKDTQTKEDAQKLEDSRSWLSKLWKK